MWIVFESRWIGHNILWVNGTWSLEVHVPSQSFIKARTQGCLVTPSSLHLRCPPKVFLASVSPALQSIQGFLTSFHHQSIIISRELLGAILKVNQHYKRNSKMLMSFVGGRGGGSRCWLLKTWRKGVSKMCKKCWTKVLYEHSLLKYFSPFQPSFFIKQYHYLNIAFSHANFVL